MERSEIESALDSHKLSVRMHNGNYWQVRRNGKTQTWKRRPNDFRIPIKAGFNSFGEITESSDIGYEKHQKYAFVIEI